jgi:hypothetical protein
MGTKATGKNMENYDFTNKIWGIPMGFDHI